MRVVTDLAQFPRWPGGKKIRAATVRERKWSVAASERQSRERQGTEIQIARGVGRGLFLGTDLEARGLDAPISNVLNVWLTAPNVFSNGNKARKPGKNIGANLLTFFRAVGYPLAQ